VLKIDHSDSALPPEVEVDRLRSDEHSMERPRDLAWNVVASLMPFVSGLAFYGWMEWHLWTPATCEAPIWTLVTWIPFLALPPIFAGVRARLVSKRWATTIAVVVLALFVTAFACYVAFFASFVRQHCGE
jgi:hypothetical protein